MQPVSVLTPEQQLALQDYTRNIYPFPGEKDKVTQARELINDILAKRDELAELLGLINIDIKMDIFDFCNPDSGIDKAAYIIAQAIELKGNDESLNCKSCELREPRRRNTTEVKNHERRFDVSIRHKK